MAEIVCLFVHLPWSRLRVAVASSRAGRYEHSIYSAALSRDPRCHSTICASGCHYYRAHAACSNACRPTTTMVSTASHHLLPRHKPLRHHLLPHKPFPPSSHHYSHHSLLPPNYQCFRASLLHHTSSHSPHRHRQAHPTIHPQGHSGWMMMCCHRY